MISSYGDVVDRIKIDARVLREKSRLMSRSIPISIYVRNQFFGFWSIEPKEREKKALFDKKCQEGGIWAGDYIYVEISYDVNAGIL